MYPSLDVNEETYLFHGIKFLLSNINEVFLKSNMIFSLYMSVMLFMLLVLTIQKKDINYIS